MSAIDQFATMGTALNSPGVTLTAVTQSDSTDLTLVTRAIHVAGAGGLVTVTPEGGSTSVQIYIGLGGLMPFRVTRIWATGTTATGIVAVT